MHLPALIQDLAVILGVAALVTFIFKRIKQPVVLGYIVAGIIVGPYTPAIFSIKDTANITIWAELGVIFLMFSLGLEFSFRRLMRVGMSAGVTALIQIIVMLLLGGLTANLLGWRRMDGVFLGCMIAISSTTIIIKALEELNLKSKKFAELVFGILVVEDLAAILMLVALTNIATRAQVDGVELLLAGGKLAIVVGAWFVGGMFLVPRFVRSVSRHGNDEMLTVVATGLCLALVALAAYFHYSAALGAFIMGSILAESSEAKRIEHLVQPLKDIFGAVFFVSVGMLLDPHAISSNLGPIALISLIIVGGKLVSVCIGALVTGQTLPTAVQTGFSMAQIGELSFIIGTLGLTYKMISPELYPMIVASSLVTTFTTPYLIKASGSIAQGLEAKLPDKVRRTLNNYIAWVQRRSVSDESRKAFSRGAIAWSLNAIVVIVFLTLGASKLIPLTTTYLPQAYLGQGLAWALSFLASAPSIWAMLTAFRVKPQSPDQKRSLSHDAILLASRMVTVLLVGLLSSAFFPAKVTVLATVGLCVLVLGFFHRHIESYYHWIEEQFESGFQGDMPTTTPGARLFDHLAPWDAHLVEVSVPARSFLVGKSLMQVKLRERFGLNVIVLIRDGETIAAPEANEPLYPKDRLLCFATDSEIDRFKAELEATAHTHKPTHEVETYGIRRIKVLPDSRLHGVSIRESGIRERFGCIVVGLERDGQRLRSPGSDLVVAAGDLIWVVGRRQELTKLAADAS